MIALVTMATVSLYLSQPPWGSASATDPNDAASDLTAAPDATASPDPATPLPSTPAPTAPVPAPSPTYAPDKVDKSWPDNPPWDACPAPVWPGEPSSGSPGDGRRVLIIGDSLTRESQESMTQYLEQSGWTPTFRCWGSKRLDWGLDQLKRAKELDQLPEYVIMALGTNDISWVQPAITEQRVNKVLDRLGPNRQVLWVDLDIDYSAFSIERAAWFNKMIRQVTKDRPNLKIVPWEKIARKNDAYRFDGIHYGTSGYTLRARELTDALNDRANAVDSSS